MQIKLLDDKQVKNLSEKIWPSQENNTTAEISRVTNILKTGKGNIASGRTAYLTTCGSCHKLFNEGGDAGPELTGYDRSDMHGLLTNIIDPDTYIREGYTLFHIITKDGRNMVGTLLSESGNSKTIRTFTGETTIITSDQLASLEPLKKSPMPSGLFKHMNDQQIRDLVHYLMSSNERLISSSSPAAR
jgi:putative heme-binding domain-containing protein